DLVLLLEQLRYTQNVRIPKSSQVDWADSKRFLDAIDQRYQRKNHKLLWAWYGLIFPVLFLAVLGGYKANQFDRMNKDVDRLLPVRPSLACSFDQFINEVRECPNKDYKDET